MKGGQSGGANLEIVADGSHIIENCWFEYEADRMGGYLGNAFVRTNSSLTVKHSTFSSGSTVDFSGYGGLQVWDAAKLQIEYSNFIGTVGGLMTHWEIQDMRSLVPVSTSLFTDHCLKGMSMLVNWRQILVFCLV